MMHGQKKNINV